jgi:hypothetical protein
MRVFNLGRFRHVEPAPDGSLWVLTANSFTPAAEDRILRLIPPG